MVDTRPNPDWLLEKINKEAEKQKRGRLKIFFGACAGVGKTFAMLNAARNLQLENIDVIVGIVETHGRAGTAAQLTGLAVLPLKTLNYRGRELTEFDLDAALARKPALILVDELAHSNVEGSRHPKRWQDIEELLAAGIDVYSTLNVQHLESLNDIVGQITGIRVTETIPDKVFDMADEVTLVDLPAEELLQRLQEGKVYQAQQAERAGKSFFRKGNLIALREMALRRTADRVDSQMREYRSNLSIQQVWQAKDRLLICVGTGAEAERLVRVAARLAHSLKSDWLAVYVETPKLQRLSDATRDSVLKTLKLAETLGAETTTLSGTQVASVVLNYARSRNVSKLVVGKSTRSALERLIWPGVVDDLTSLATDIDIHVVSREKVLAEKTTQTLDSISNIVSTHQDEQISEDSKLKGYYLAAAACAATSLIAHLILPYFELSNVVMLFLLGVILISSKYGRGPGIFSSIISVACFDFFFVTPRFSFSVSDTQYLLTFAVMFIVAFVISNLTSNLRYQAVVAMHRERRSRALYDLGKSLASALTSAHIIEISVHHLTGIFQSKIAILLPDSQEKVTQPTLNHLHDKTLDIDLDLGIAQWVYDHQQQAGFGTNTLPSAPILYIPLQAPMRTRGVLAIVPNSIASKTKRTIFLPEQRQLLDTFASQIAIAIERVHYVDVAQDALVSMESERLRNSVLSAISHDLNTPLTTIVATADLLKQQLAIEQKESEEQESKQAGKKYTRKNDAKRREYVEMLYEQSIRMKNLVVNLLDMARLQSGKVKLKKQWQMLEEVVGTALRTMKQPLIKHHIVVDLTNTHSATSSGELPLIEFDAVLIDRVLCNLLDNAAKYTPEGSKIVISARIQQQNMLVSVSDEGPGLPESLENQMFDKFTRGEKESAKAGVGLGLSICKAIIEAHGGKIWASNKSPSASSLTGTRAETGAIFTFSLPLGTPPNLPADELAN